MKFHTFAKPQTLAVIFMKISILNWLFLLLAIQSCQTSLTQNATKWSQGIKQKIIEDANKKSTKTIFDSTRNKVTYLRGKIKLKSYQMKRDLDSLGKITYYDTAVSIFYSADQNFELVRELCPLFSESAENIRYKGDWIGLSELRFCDGKIKNISFSYGVSVGEEIEYDSTGNIINRINHGKSELLKELTRIKYYR